jgi:predicted TPR repeat methyltransferase
MDFNTIDWNTMWQQESTNHRWDRLSSRELWDKRAEGFSKRIDRVMGGKEESDKDDYMYKMLEHIETQPDWTVLDIGCGPGTLTIPLSRKVKRVSALDISSEMLKHLKANADTNGLNNIRYIQTSWQDAFAQKQLDIHDVVVASRSLMSGDMQQAMRDILPLARKAAYITFPVVHLPFDWEVYQAIGRANRRHPPYIYIYNMLFQMGVMANVEILKSKVTQQFSNIEEAIDNLQWRTDTFTDEEKHKLTGFLQQKFAEQPGAPAFTHRGYSKWALIWWKTEQQL